MGSSSGADSTLGAVPKTDTEICKAILESIKPINGAKKTFVYQCRPGDDCGGASDRFAGVMSGIYFALLSDRQFKMHWPGIDHVFHPQTINWHFNATDIGLTEDAALHKGFITKTWGAGTFSDPFLPQHRNIGMFNDLNTGEIGNPRSWPKLAVYDHVFYHSNRGPDVKNLYSNVAAKYHWPTGDDQLAHNYYIAYRCLFNDMFTATPDFMNTPYKPLLREVMPFSDVLKIAADSDYVSLAYHYRINDNHVESDPVEARVSDAEIRWLKQFGEEHRAQSTQKMNLFFISNSVASAKKVIQDAGIRESYNAVYSQELTGSRHINSDKSATPHSLKQAMMDWFIMKEAHYLVCGKSGFCKIAGTVASEQQVKYDAVTKKEIPHTYTVCTNRDC